MSNFYDSPDDWFSGTLIKTKKSKGGAGGNTISSTRKKTNTNTTKNTVKGINNKLPQVVVKISGSSNGANKAQGHLNYIGRHGNVEIEDEQGNAYLGEQQKKLIDSWRAMGMHEKHETGARKEAFHFVFSMPKGTNPEAMKQAVKNLVAEEFEGHKYFLAQHLDTDKPHVHVLINATDDRGARLNPRKADLHNYRVQFVHKLAEQGIQAIATRKVHSFNYVRNKTQQQIHRGENSKGLENKTQKSTQKQILKAYQSYAQQPTTEPEIKKEIKKLLNSKTKEIDKGR